MTAICCPGDAPCAEHRAQALITLHRELLDGLYEACRALDSWEEFRWLTFHLNKVRDAQRIADGLPDQAEYLKRDLTALRNAISKAKTGFAALGGDDRSPFRRIGIFKDQVSSKLCALVRPIGGGLAGVEHPDCATLADLSVDLDAFYCQRCRMNGRVSGAWCADLIAKVPPR